MEKPNQTSFGIGDALFHGLAANISQTAVGLMLLAQLRGQKLESDDALAQAYELFDASSVHLRTALPSATEVSGDEPSA